MKEDPLQGALFVFVNKLKNETSQVTNRSSVNECLGITLLEPDEDASKTDHGGESAMELFLACVDAED